MDQNTCKNVKLLDVFQKYISLKWTHRIRDYYIKNYSEHGIR